MTYLEAVEFLAEVLGPVSPGPRPGEVTFTHTEDNSVATTVLDETVVIGVAGASLRARMRNLLLAVTVSA